MRTYKKNPETGIVWVRFYIKSEKIHFTTGISCQVDHWDQLEIRIRYLDPNYKDKNTIIQSIISRINDVFVKYRLRNKTLTPTSFKRAYNRPDDYKTFFEFVDEWQRKYGYKNELSTMAVHKTVIKKIKE